LNIIDGIELLRANIKKIQVSTLVLHDPNELVTKYEGVTWFKQNTQIKDLQIIDEQVLDMKHHLICNCFETVVDEVKEWCDHRIKERGNGEEKEKE